MNSNKPKTNRKGDIEKPSNYDQCLTPPYGILPLLPFIPKNWTIWEPAAGRGVMVDAFQMRGRDVFGTTIEHGENYFYYIPVRKWDISVTNVPFSIKYQWLERGYELGEPFAWLMPVEMIGAARAQRCFDKYGIEIIYMDKRIDFIMPEMELNGHGAQFPVAWYTWGLNIGRQMTFVKLDKPKREDTLAWWEEWKKQYENILG